MSVGNSIDRVTFYIPCFNAARYIKDCIEAVLSQTFPVDEIFLIDDGPGDDTVRIASKYPITIVKRSQKLGLPSARNVAVQKAKNEFVAAVDADCAPEPDWLEKLMDNFADKDIGGVGGRLIEKYTDSAADLWRSLRMPQHWGDKKIINPDFLFGCNHVFRKDVITKAGGYNEKYSRSNEDGDLSRRLKKNGYKIIYEPEAKAYHLRKDSIGSVFRTYWTWHFWWHPPSSLKNIRKRFQSKLRTAFYHWVPGDLKHSRLSMALLDAIFPFDQLYRDIRYYLALGKNRSGIDQENHLLGTPY